MALDEEQLQLSKMEKKGGVKMGSRRARSYRIFWNRDWDRVTQVLRAA